MPAIPLHVLPPSESNTVVNPLPPLLHTPSGLALIELQGSVLSEEGDGISTALELGGLVFPAAEDAGEGDIWDGKRVVLFIGKHQKMTGEVKKLTKPLAMIRRANTQEPNPTHAEQVEVVEIVHYKILFNHRPEPVGAGQHAIIGDS